MKNENQVLRIPVGAPACGKSTDSIKWVEEDPKTRVRINRDSIREMMGPYWIPSREPLAQIMENDLLLTALRNGYSVVLDATNFKFKDSVLEKDIINIYPNLKIEYIDFTHVSAEECIKRDKARDRSVGAMVIRSFYKNYINKNEKEG